MYSPTNIHGACSDSAMVIAVAAEFGLQPGKDYEICLGREIAASLFKGAIAPASLIRAVHKITTASAFCYRQHGEMTGFLALFPLRQAGKATLDAHTFNAFDFDLDLVAPPGETPAALYGWGFAATTRRAGAAVVSALAAIQSQLFWAIPKYARVASDQGARIVFRKMGYRRSFGRDPAMIYIPPMSGPGASL